MTSPATWNHRRRRGEHGYGNQLTIFNYELRANNHQLRILDFMVVWIEPIIFSNSSQSLRSDSVTVVDKISESLNNLNQYFVSRASL